MQSSGQTMSDLDKALADIFAIRSQIAAGTAFRGYGPAAVAATGGLALATAIVQFLWLDDPTRHPMEFFFGWAAAALVSGSMIWIEMQARSRRHHSGLADVMIHQAIEQFLPAGVAGVLLAVMLLKFAPETLWLLPGLWQVLVSLGIFASVRSLPRTVAFAGAWYFVAGFGCLLLASQSHTLSPWTMGLPFVIGQLLMAAILHFASGDHDVED
jgi:predicted membrane channel-forming protein YqfA (hemolysin III family)